MQELRCFAAIKSRYPLLTNAEKKVADYIISESTSIPELTVAELGKKAGVAGSAVIRFCKKIGFTSFANMKLRVAVELIGQEHPYSPSVRKGDNVITIADKVFASGIKTLRDTAKMLDKVALSRLVEAISQASKIFIFGIGTSAPLVSDAAYRLMQLGFSVFYSSDVVAMKMLTMNIEPNDLAIGISHSGRTAATVDTLKLAKQQKAQTACITSFMESPLFMCSDFGITVYSEESSYPVEAISSRVAHICVMDTIAVSLAAENFEKTSERMQTAQTILDDLRYKR